MAHSVRVLLVDSNSSDATDLRQKLASTKSVPFIVQTAGTIREAYGILNNKHFDVLLIDLETPGSGGITTLQQLQAIVPETPVLVISSLYDESESLETVRAGAQDYLVKSRLNAAALERILTHCIERQRAKSRTQMQYLVSRVLTEAEEQKQANVGILKLLCEFLEYEFGQIWMFDHWSAELIAAESWQFPPGKYNKFEEASHELRFERGCGLPGRSWEQGKPLWISDISVASEFSRAQIALQEGLHSALVFPITLKSEVLGVVELFSKDLREPDEGAAYQRASIAVGLCIRRNLRSRPERVHHLYEPRRGKNVPLRAGRCERQKLACSFSSHPHRWLTLRSARLSHHASA
jgi:DNA-binding NarL/FixJ family response regulator